MAAAPPPDASAIGPDVSYGDEEIDNSNSNGSIDADRITDEQRFQTNMFSEKNIEAYMGIYAELKNNCTIIREAYDDSTVLDALTATDISPTEKEDFNLMVPATMLFHGVDLKEFGGVEYKDLWRTMMDYYFKDDVKMEDPDKFVRRVFNMQDFLFYLQNSPEIIECCPGNRFKPVENERNKKLMADSIAGARSAQDRREKDARIKAGKVNDPQIQDNTLDAHNFLVRIVKDYLDDTPALNILRTKLQTHEIDILDGSGRRVTGIVMQIVIDAYAKQTNKILNAQEWKRLTGRSSLMKALGTQGPDCFRKSFAFYSTPGTGLSYIGLKPDAHEYTDEEKAEYKERSRGDYLAATSRNTQTSFVRRSEALKQAEQQINPWDEGGGESTPSSGAPMESPATVVASSQAQQQPPPLPYFPPPRLPPQPRPSTSSFASSDSGGQRGFVGRSSPSPSAWSDNRGSFGGRLPHRSSQPVLAGNDDTIDSASEGEYSDDEPEVIAGKQRRNEIRRSRKREREEAERKKADEERARKFGYGIPAVDNTEIGGGAIPIVARRPAAQEEASSSSSSSTARLVPDPPVCESPKEWPYAAPEQYGRPPLSDFIVDQTQHNERRRRAAQLEPTLNEMLNATGSAKASSETAAANCWDTPAAPPVQAPPAPSLPQAPAQAAPLPPPPPSVQQQFQPPLPPPPAQPAPSQSNPWDLIPAAQPMQTAPAAVQPQLPPLAPVQQQFQSPPPPPPAQPAPPQSNPWDFVPATQPVQAAPAAVQLQPPPVPAQATPTLPPPPGQQTPSPAPPVQQQYQPSPPLQQTAPTQAPYQPNAPFPQQQFGGQQPTNYNAYNSQAMQQPQSPMNATPIPYPQQGMGPLPPMQPPQQQPMSGGPIPYGGGGQPSQMGAPPSTDGNTNSGNFAPQYQQQGLPPYQQQQQQPPMGGPTSPGDNYSQQLPMGGGGYSSGAPPMYNPPYQGQGQWNAGNQQPQYQQNYPPQQQPPYQQGPNHGPGGQDPRYGQGGAPPPPHRGYYQGPPSYPPHYDNSRPTSAYSAYDDRRDSRAPVTNQMPPMEGLHISERGYSNAAYRHRPVSTDPMSRPDSALTEPEIASIGNDGSESVFDSISQVGASRSRRNGEDNRHGRPLSSSTPAHSMIEDRGGRGGGGHGDGRGGSRAAYRCSGAEENDLDNDRSSTPTQSATSRAATSHSTRPQQPRPAYNMHSTIPTVHNAISRLDELRAFILTAVTAKHRAGTYLNSSTLVRIMEQLYSNTDPRSDMLAFSAFDMCGDAGDPISVLHLMQKEGLVDLRVIRPSTGDLAITLGAEAHFIVVRDFSN